MLSKGALEKFVIISIRQLSINELFIKVEYALEQSPLMDHRSQLIKILLRKFFTMFVYYYAKFGDTKTEQIRTMWTKFILFKNQ